MREDHPLIKNNLVLTSINVIREAASLLVQVSVRTEGGVGIEKLLTKGLLRVYSTPLLWVNRPDLYIDFAPFLHG